MTNEKKLTHPTIHLNGSSPQTLREDYRKAAYAVHDAIEALAAASPNARDYYVQGDGVINQAVAEHRDRLQRLEAVQAELVELYHNIRGRKGEEL